MKRKLRVFAVAVSVVMGLTLSGSLNFVELHGVRPVLAQDSNWDDEGKTQSAVAEDPTGAASVQETKKADANVTKAPEKTHDTTWDPGSTGAKGSTTTVDIFLTTNRALFHDLLISMASPELSTPAYLLSVRTAGKTQEFYVKYGQSSYLSDPKNLGEALAGYKAAVAKVTTHLNATLGTSSTITFNIADKLTEDTWGLFSQLAAIGAKPVNFQILPGWPGDPKRGEVVNFAALLCPPEFDEVLSDFDDFIQQNRQCLGLGNAPVQELRGRISCSGFNDPECQGGTCGSIRPKDNTIKLCTNNPGCRLKWTKDKIREILIHELTHFFDFTCGGKPVPAFPDLADPRAPQKLLERCQYAIKAEGLAYYCDGDCSTAEICCERQWASSLAHCSRSQIAQINSECLKMLSEAPLCPVSARMECRGTGKECDGCVRKYPVHVVSPPQGEREARRTGCEGGCGQCVCLKPHLERWPRCREWRGLLTTNGHRCENWTDSYAPCIVTSCVTRDDNGSPILGDTNTAAECQGTFEVWPGVKRSPYQCGGKPKNWEDNEEGFKSQVTTSNCIDNSPNWPGLWTWRQLPPYPQGDGYVLGHRKWGYILQTPDRCEEVPVNFTLREEVYICAGSD